MKTPPTTEGPKPITIEEYRARQHQARPAVDSIKIPIVKKPQRRGGHIQRLKREKSLLWRETQRNQPPTWEDSCRLWDRIDNIDKLIKSYLQSRGQKPTHEMNVFLPK